MGYKQALVFGASGIPGWAITRSCLSYPPAHSTFTRDLALTNKPLDKECFLLPKETSERLEVYSGIDLTSGIANVTQKLHQISEIEKVTHVFYTGKSRHLIPLQSTNNKLYSLYGPWSRLPNCQKSKCSTPRNRIESNHDPLSRPRILDPTNRRKNIRRRILRPTWRPMGSPPQRNSTTNSRTIRVKHFLLFSNQFLGCGKQRQGVEILPDPS